MAIAGDLPTVLWIVLTSLAGACTVAFGLMLIIGALDTSEFQMATTTERLDDSMWWYGITLALAIAGIIVRVRRPEQLRGTVRAVWVGAGGRPFRSG